MSGATDGIEISAPEGKHALGLRVVDSDGKDILPPPPPLTIETTNPLGLANIDVTLNGLRFQKPGIYSFVLAVDQTDIGARDFFVERMTATEP